VEIVILITLFYMPESLLVGVLSLDDFKRSAAAAGDGTMGTM
jgi:hypothetical protein